MGEIGDRQVVIAFLGRNREQACSIGALELLALVTALGPDQVGAADNLGNTDFGRVEVAAFLDPDDIEDAV
jgi:hypothetical protein